MGEKARMGDNLNEAASRLKKDVRVAEDLQQKMHEANERRAALEEEDAREAEARRADMTRDNPRDQDLRHQMRELEDKIEKKNVRDKQRFTPSEREERQIEQELASHERQIQALERQLYDFKRAWTSTPEGQAEQQKVEVSLQKMYQEQRELQWNKKRHEHHLHGGPEPPLDLGSLHVRVYGCEHLEPDSGGGGFFQQSSSCDPYVKLRFCGVECRTMTAFNKENPVWDEDA